MIDWSRGFCAAYHACLVDPETWRDIERIEILSGKINREKTGLRESADIECTDYDHGYDKWIRVWMDVEQDESGADDHRAIFTGLVSTPEQTINGRLIETDLQCYSVLKPAQDIYLPRGWYAAKGMIGAEIAASLLSVGPAPVVIEEGSPRLVQHIIAEANETNLSMADRIVNAIGWRIRIEGDGTIVVCPKADGAQIILSANDNDIIEPKVTVKNDGFSCPNVIRVVSDNVSYTAYDHDETSPFSIESRGREIWREESNVKLSDGESLASYATRRLRELQSAGTSVSYSRSYYPDVITTDNIRIHYPAQGLSGIFAVESQQITLDNSGSTSEEATLI